MTDLRPVRGAHDWLPADYRVFDHIARTAERLASRSGFAAMATPILEFLSVFQRPLGETSDIVSKEMFVLSARGDGEGETMVLRPEGTAPTMRAILSNKLTHQLPLKYFYTGPMFRYDRPQKGRLREFHQIGVEAVGYAAPETDVEVIALAWRILQALGIQDVTLELNTLGDAESRQAYRAVLVDKLSVRASELSPESQVRLTKNPLRILDSKDPRDQDIVATLPDARDYLSPAAALFFERVQSGLRSLQIPFTVNPRLVRGLDYYAHTVFEITTTALGAQATLLGGGRYDGLMPLMGGPEAPSVGWAAGVERLALLFSHTLPTPRRICFLGLGEETYGTTLQLVEAARQVVETPIDAFYMTSLKTGLKRANQVGAHYGVVVGESECANRMALVKNMETGAQTSLPFDDLPLYLKDLIQ